METDVTRTDPGGTQKTRWPVDDDECAGLEGANARIRGWSSRIARPCRPIKIAQQLTEAQVTANDGIDLPLYGDGVYEAVDNNPTGGISVTLDTGGTGQGIAGGIPTWFDAAGLLNVPWDTAANHASAGDGRLIVTYTPSTRVAVPERVFNTAPTTSGAGRFYRNLIDCRWYSKLRLKVELSQDGATCELEVILFGWPKSRKNELAVSTATDRPIRMGDFLLPVSSLHDQADVLESGYWNGRYVEVPCDGMYGALIRVKTISTGHSISVWAAAS